MVKEKVVKQKVADKKAGTENTENEENDKLIDNNLRTRRKMGSQKKKGIFPGKWLSSYLACCP